MHIFSSKTKRGFTLAETLSAVAILVVLFGLISLSTTEIINRLTQTKLDNMAKTVYVTAQNNLTKLVAAGRGKELVYREEDVNMRKLTTTPADYDTVNYKYNEHQLTVVSYDSLVSELLVPRESLDSNARYIIEYDPVLGDVYSVFYYEANEFAEGGYEGFYDGDSKGTTSEDVNQIRGLIDDRIAYGSVVGYYGGHVRNNGGSQANRITADIVITNKEVLKADFDINMPAGKQNRKIKLTITIKGNASGAKRTIVHETGAEDYNSKEFSFTSETGAVRQYSLIIDQLDTRSFADYYTDFYPGEDLTINLKVVDNEGDILTPFIAAAKPTPEVVNSLFASVEENDDHNIANIAYIRHLQNLNNYDYADLGIELPGGNPIIANQIRDLDFTNKKIDEYRDIYPSRSYTPISNPGIYGYNGNGYVISDLTTNTTNAGLFGTFYGKSFENIIIEDATLSGTNAGSLAGVIVNNGSDSINNTITINNCYSLLTRDFYRNKIHKNIYDNYELTNPYISATSNAGGLIGAFGLEGNAGILNIKNSFAATTIKGNEFVGGLVGNANYQTNIETSYSDSYLVTLLTGDAGGLLGKANASSTVTGSYVSGYLLGECNLAAGIVPNKIASVNNFYSNLDTIFATVTRANDKPEEVVDIMGYSIAPKVTSCTNVYYVEMPNLENKTGAQRIALDDLRKASVISTKLSSNYFNFDFENNTTIPYNMLDELALVAYPYPTVKITPVGTHETNIRRHYGDWNEIIQISGNIAYIEFYTDGTVGMYTPGSDRLHRTKTIAYDTYAIIYELRDIESAAADREVRFYGNGETITATITGYQKLRADGEDFYFKLLPSNIVNSEATAGKFYQKIEIENGDEDKIFFFNPGYAKAITTVDDPNAPEIIYIRTARHINRMSTSYDSTIQNIGESSFIQERDVNFNTYEWNVDALKMGKISSIQAIASTSNPFIADYDGQYHTITGVSFTANADKQAALIGYVSEDSTVKNIFLSNKYDYTKPENSPSVTLDVTSGEGYAGTIAAYNLGSIENCASDNYVMNITTNGATNMYIGGFVGKNDGYIYNSSSDIPIINANSASSNTYIGGFTGYNSNIIRYAYALGKINAYRNNSEGNVYAAGFTAYNNNISRAYSTVAVNTGNDFGVNVYGFAPTAGTAGYCYYLNNNFYSYAGEQLNYQFDDAKTSGSPRTLSTLASTAISGFNKADNAYDHDIVGADAKFPLKTSVSSGGTNYVHYGEWPEEPAAGEFGFYYWEKEGNEYHYHLIASKQGKADSVYNTLCEEYDCHDPITDFGYGYYVKEEFDSATRNWSNTFNSEYAVGDKVSEVSEKIAADIKATSGYKFYSYKSGNNSVLYSTSSADATLNIEVNGVNYYYSFAPLFGDSFVKDGNLEEYKTRSIEQIQNINWNSKDRSARTEDTTSNKGANFLYLSNGNSNGKAYNFRQTHNVEAKNCTNYVPIGTNIDNTTYDSLGFHGTYDGQGYEINNLSISSTTTSIGLFGVVNDATIKNVIMYCPNNDGTIDRGRRPAESEKWTDLTGLRRLRNENDKTIAIFPEGNTTWIGSYYVGTVVGFLNGNSTIENCAAAGYTISDNTFSNIEQPLFQTNGYMGGLVGGAKSKYKKQSPFASNRTDLDKQATIKNCTANVDINLFEENPQRLAETGRHADIRAAGLAGSASYIENCYSGGNITIDTGRIFTTNHATYYVAGIVGSIDDCMLRERSLLTVLETDFVLNDTLVVKNSYSYSNVPNANFWQHLISDLWGRNSVSAAVASLGERYYNTKNVSNCYYFTTGDYAEENNYYYNYDILRRVSMDGMDVTRQQYNQMISDEFIDTLDEDYGRAVHTYNVTDFYSAKAYPFPAIIVRNGEYVHYGDWLGVYNNIAITKSQVNLDMFSMTTEGDTTTFDSIDNVTITYYDANGIRSDMTEAPTITFGQVLPTATSDIVDCTLTRNDDNPVTYNLEIKAKDKKDVTETINITYAGHTLTMRANVTGDLVFNLVEVDPDKDLFEKEITDINEANVKHYTATVTDRNGRKISDLDNTKWSVAFAKEGVAELSSVTNNPDGTYDLVLKAIDDEKPDYIERTSDIQVKHNEVKVNGNETYSIPTSTIMDSITVYPVVEKVKVEYYDGNDVIHTQEINFGDPFTEDDLYHMTTAQLNGRTFADWQYNNSPVELPIEALRKNIKLVAKYDFYTIRLYDDNIPDVEPGALDVIYACTDPTTGVTTYYQDSNLKASIDKVKIPSKPYSGFAGYWNKDRTIRFTEDDGKFNPEISITSDQEYFVNWNNTLRIIKFYNDGEFTGNYVEYEIGYNRLIGVTDPGAPDEVIPENPHKDHYEFLGWAVESPEGEILFNTNKEPQILEGYYEQYKWVNRDVDGVRGDYNVYAKYKKIDSTLTLSKGYGEESDSDYKVNYYLVNNDTKVNGYTEITRDHYTLEGYYLNLGEETETKVVNADGSLVNTTIKDADENIIIDAGKWNYVPTDLELEAKWTQKDSQITLKPGATGTDPSGNIADGWLANGEASWTGRVHTKRGYLLDGYFDGNTLRISGIENADGSHSLANPTAWNTAPTNSEFMAKWTPITYKVVYNNNGGTGSINVQNCTYDQPCTLNSNADKSITKSGWSFQGWSEDPNASTPTYYVNHYDAYNLSDTENAEVTLYAVWKVESLLNLHSGSLSNADIVQNISLENGNTIDDVGLNSKISLNLSGREEDTDDWILMGWYRYIDGNAVQYIEAYDKQGNTYKYKFVPNVENWTDGNGKLANLTSGTYDLYAGWKKTFSEDIFLYQPTINRYNSGTGTRAEFMIVNKGTKVETNSNFTILQPLNGQSPAVQAVTINSKVNSDDQYLIYDESLGDANGVDTTNVVYFKAPANDGYKNYAWTDAYEGIYSDPYLMKYSGASSNRWLGERLGSLYFRETRTSAFPWTYDGSSLRRANAISNTYITFSGSSYNSSRRTEAYIYQFCEKGYTIYDYEN